MVVADEDVAKLCPAPPAFAWIYDITDETNPMPIATFQVAGPRQRRRAAAADDGLPPALRALHRDDHPVRLVRAGAAHRRHRRPVRATRGRPFRAGRAAGASLASSNDVTIDDRGLIYLVDRVHGVDIIETSVF